MTPDENRPAGGAALEDAVAAVRALAEKRKAPTRHHVRDLLLALGAAIRAGEESEVTRAHAALSVIVPAFGPRWPAVVADELALACTEHVRSVDPRYLDHPRYDFEYTVAARERLELRLRAAQRLGLPATSEWLARVARADAQLAASMKRRRKRTEP
jgi:hypothetical protein